LLDSVRNGQVSLLKGLTLTAEIYSRFDGLSSAGALPSRVFSRPWQTPYLVRKGCLLGCGETSLMFQVTTCTPLGGYSAIAVAVVATENSIRPHVGR